MRVPAGSIRTLLIFFALAALGLAGCESRPPAREPDPDSPAVQLRRITASDAQDEDQFGWSVDLDGDDLIAGTNIISSHDYRSGKAFMHARNAGGTDAWGEVEKIEAVNGEYFDMYGYSVAVDGDIAVVGAPWEDQAEEDAGSAYVYARNQGGSGSWGLLKKLTASDAGSGDGFGHAVAIDGDVIIVGAAYSSSVTWAGGVAYVYVRDQGGADNWGEAARIVPGDLPEAAYFGFSVSLHGDLAVIGSLYDIGPGNRCGAAYVFARDLGGPGAWGEVKKLTAYRRGRPGPIRLFRRRLRRPHHRRSGLEARGRSRERRGLYFRARPGWSRELGPDQEALCGGHCGLLGCLRRLGLHLRHARARGRPRRGRFRPGPGGSLCLLQGPRRGRRVGGGRQDRALRRQRELRLRRLDGHGRRTFCGRSPAQARWRQPPGGRLHLPAQILKPATSSRARMPTRYSPGSRFRSRTPS